MNGRIAHGAKIAAVGPSRSTRVPAGAETIDASGRTLMPGLWDMHAHLGDADGPLNLPLGDRKER